MGDFLKVSKAEIFPGFLQYSAFIISFTQGEKLFQAQEGFCGKSVNNMSNTKQSEKYKRRSEETIANKSSLHAGLQQTNNCREYTL
jgi:hypothetical protein